MKMFPKAWRSSDPARALSPYLSPEDCDALIEMLADGLGAEIVQYGTSKEGRPLSAVRIPCPDPNAKAVLCGANIHGPEFIGRHVAIGLLTLIHQVKLGIVSDPELERLLARAEVWIVTCYNPDGYARTWQAAGKGRMAFLRPNASGVDLNRNFPLPLGAALPRLPFSGSTRKGDATYRGTHPLSEPETAAVDALCQRVDFVAAANLHSTMGTVIPAHVKDKASFKAYRRLIRAIRGAQKHRKYWPLSSRKLDVFTGEQEDYQHHFRNTWAVCIEVFSIWDNLVQHLFAPSLFWKFNPADPHKWIENDVPAIVAFFNAALDLGRRPQD